LELQPLKVSDEVLCAGIAQRIKLDLT